MGEQDGVQVVVARGRESRVMGVVQVVWALTRLGSICMDLVAFRLCFGLTS